MPKPRSPNLGVPFPALPSCTQAVPCRGSLHSQLLSFPRPSLVAPGRPWPLLTYDSPQEQEAQQKHHGGCPVGGSDRNSAVALGPQLPLHLGYLSTGTRITLSNRAGASGPVPAPPQSEVTRATWHGSGVKGKFPVLLLSWVP